jgi:hypothetical protein
MARLRALPMLAVFVLACTSDAIGDGPSTSAAGARAVPEAGATSSAGGAGGAGNPGGAGNAGAAALPIGGSSNPVGGMAGASVGGAPTASAGAGAEVGGSSGAAGASGSAGAGGALASGGSAGAGAGGALGTWKNPILPGYNADPQIAMFGGKFYIYPTSDGFANWLGAKFHAWSSPDLAQWTDEGVVLDLGPGVSWADDKAWAPGIAFKGDTYYFYFSAGQAIGVATGKSPSGPFKDALGHALVKVGEYGVQAIDPYAFTDDDGRSYLYFGSSSSARVVELNADMISFKGTPQTITIAGFREGSVAFKRSGKYYFMYSVNDTRDATYNVAYGIGSSPLGPFTKPAVNPVLVKDEARGILATGHNSVLALPNGDYYIAYHRFAIPNGDGTHREVCLDKLEFNSDGSILPVKPTR